VPARLRDPRLGVSKVAEIATCDFLRRVLRLNFPK
jgi:hypothetical protein